MKRVRVVAPGETAERFEQMVDGLATAYEHGVVHRNSQPDSVVSERLSSGSLAVKTVDFGLAKIHPSPAPEDPDRTFLVKLGVRTADPRGRSIRTGEKTQSKGGSRYVPPPAGR